MSAWSILNGPLPTCLCGFGAAAVLLSLFAGSIPAAPSTERPAQGSRSVISDEARKHNQSGIDLARQRNHRAAAIEFQEAVRLRPDYAEAHYNLGVALEALGELGQAIDAFRSALKLRPASAPMHRALGLALLKGYHLEDAVAELRRSLELDPGSAEAHYNLGLAFGQQGRVE
ncbi:MAG: hypothetical protein DMG08_29455, partial [Acidobacteria bacterium]